MRAAVAPIALQRLPDGRHRRAGPPRERQVVEARRRSARRGSRTPRPAGRLVHAQGLQVVRREDGGRRSGSASRAVASAQPTVHVERPDRGPDSGSTGTPRRPSPPGSRRAGPGRTATAGRPPIIAMRRWPRSSRCRVATRPPVQLVAPTDGVSCSGSPVGSTVDQRDRPGASAATAGPAVRSEPGPRSPRYGRRASTCSVHALPGREPALHLGQDDGEVVLARDLLDAPDDLQRPQAVQGVERQLEQARPGRPRSGAGTRARAGPPPRGGGCPGPRRSGR